jgi:hypothetical protein
MHHIPCSPFKTWLCVKPWLQLFCLKCYLFCQIVCMRKFRILILTKYMRLVLSVHEVDFIALDYCNSQHRNTFMNRKISGRSDNDNFLHWKIIYETPQGSSTIPVTKVHKPPGYLVRSNQIITLLTVPYTGRGGSSWRKVKYGTGEHAVQFLRLMLYVERE